MKRVAIPVKNGILSEYFGQCGYYEIIEIDHSTLVSNTVEVPPRMDRGQLPEWLKEQGITDLVVHRIDKAFIPRLTSLKVGLFIGVPLLATRRLIQDYLSGKLRSDSRIIQQMEG